MWSATVALSYVLLQRALPDICMHSEPEEEVRVWLALGVRGLGVPGEEVCALGRAFLLAYMRCRVRVRLWVRKLECSAGRSSRMDAHSIGAKSWRGCYHCVPCLTVKASYTCDCTS